MNPSPKGGSGFVSHTMNFEILNVPNAKGIEAKLRYDPNDPYAVSLVFRHGGGEITWTFAREFLIDGTWEPTGDDDGDIHIWPCLSSAGEAVTVVELCSPDGEALLQCSSRKLKGFIEKMIELVPQGSESKHLQIDKELAEILG